MPELKSSPDMEFNTVQREVIRSNGSEDDSVSKPEFKAAVGLSREWDARKAGREVARGTLERLDGDLDSFKSFWEGVGVLSKIIHTSFLSTG